MFEARLEWPRAASRRARHLKSEPASISAHGTSLTNCLALPMSGVGSNAEVDDPLYWVLTLVERALLGDPIYATAIVDLLGLDVEPELLL